MFCFWVKKVTTTFNAAKACVVQVPILSRLKNRLSKNSIHQVITLAVWLYKNSNILLIKYLDLACEVVLHQWYT